MRLVKGEEHITLQSSMSPNAAHVPLVFKKTIASFLDFPLFKLCKKIIILRSKLMNFVCGIFEEMLAYISSYG